MPQSLPILFIPDKQKTATDPSDLPIAFRTIERWANHITLQTGITQITSVDGSVTITNPTGPTTDLHVAAGGGAAYASLTGPGYTTTPGDLTQAGGFTVNNPSGGSAMGIQLINNTTASNMQLINYGGQLNIQNHGNNGMNISDLGTQGLYISGVAAATPGDPGATLPTSVRMYGSYGVLIESYSGQPNVFPGNNFDGCLTLYSNHGQPIRFMQGATASYVNFWVQPAAPTGNINGRKGDICFDTGTPGIWMCVAAGTGSGSWTMYTLP